MPIIIPQIYALVVGVGLLLVIRGVVLLGRINRIKPGFCACGYDLAGLPTGSVCPECGKKASDQTRIKNGGATSITIAIALSLLLLFVPLLVWGWDQSWNEKWMLVLLMGLPVVMPFFIASWFAARRLPKAWYLGLQAITFAPVVGTYGWGAWEHFCFSGFLDLSDIFPGIRAPPATGLVFLAGAWYARVMLTPGYVRKNE